jgi:hypothetical protein
MAEISIFISYRRDDDAARAMMLDRIISGTFNEPARPPRVRIYRDTAERLGVQWPEEVRDRCSSADMVLVVIGPKWLEAKDQYARRRIDQADDWVRQEIELARDRTVIPIAFGGADIPPAKALPETISYLASRQGVRVRDERADMDLQPVLLAIEQRIPSAEIRGSRRDYGGDRRHLSYLPLDILVSASASTCTWIVEAIPHLWLRSGPGFDYPTVDRLYYGRRAYGNCDGVESGGTTWYLLRGNGDGWAWGNSEYLQPVREP